MTVEAKKLGVGAFGELDIVNLKCEEDDLKELIDRESILPAYHMNKKRWISVILDEQDDLDETIIELTQKSYKLTAPKSKKILVED